MRLQQDAHISGCSDKVFWSAGATALGKLHLVSLAAPEEAEREGDRSLQALSACLQVRQPHTCIHPFGSKCSVTPQTEDTAR